MYCGLSTAAEVLLDLLPNYIHVYANILLSSGNIQWIQRGSNMLSGTT